MFQNTSIGILVDNKRYKAICMGGDLEGCRFGRLYIIN